MSDTKKRKLPENWRKPLYIYAVQGTDGSLIAGPFWYREHAVERSHRDCPVIKFHAEVARRKPSKRSPR